MKKILPKFFISVSLVLGNLIMLVKFDSLETKKVFGANSSCYEDSVNVSNMEGWGLEGVWLYQNNNYNNSNLDPCSHFTYNQVNYGTWTNYAPNWNVGNDSVSSLRIVGSFKVKIYKDANSSGDVFEFNTGWQNEYYTEIDLANKIINGVYNQWLQDFDNAISSIEVETVSNCVNKYQTNFNPNNSSTIFENGVYFFENENYAGRCTLMSMRRDIKRGDQTINTYDNFFFADNMWNWFVGNDAVSSIYVRSGWDLVVKTDAEGKGEYKNQQSSTTLLDSAWNDKISSMDVTDEDTVQFFLHQGISPKSFRNISWRDDSSVYNSGLYYGEYTEMFEEVRSRWDSSLKSLNIQNNSSSGTTSVVNFIQDRYDNKCEVAGGTAFYYLDSNNQIQNDVVEGFHGAKYIEVYGYHDGMKKYINPEDCMGTLWIWSDNAKISNLTHEYGHMLSLGHNTDSQNTVMRQGMQSIGPQTDDWWYLKQRSETFKG